KIENEIRQIKADIISAIRSKADAETVQNMQTQLDHLDRKLAERIVTGGGTTQKSLTELLKEDEGFARLSRDRRGSAVITLTGEHALLEQKTTILDSGVGAATTGVLPLDRESGITAEARQALRLRNLLTVRPTTQAYIDYVKVGTPMAPASIQIEGN